MSRPEFTSLSLRDKGAQDGTFSVSDTATIADGETETLDLNPIAAPSAIYQMHMAQTSGFGDNVVYNANIETDGLENNFIAVGVSANLTFDPEIKVEHAQDDTVDIEVSNSSGSTIEVKAVARYRLA